MTGGEPPQALRDAVYRMRALTWNRLRGTWRMLKELTLGGWKNPTGAAQAVGPAQRRRHELVNRIQQLARDEAQRDPSSKVQDPGSRHRMRISNRKDWRS